MKGLIALDIDGTLIEAGKDLTDTVKMTLTSLSKEGWTFIIITGRIFPWCQKQLSSLTFPYYLALQNGATILHMPSQKVISRQYLNKMILPYAENICFSFQSDFIIYSGYDLQDICYYRPQNFSKEMQRYFKERMLACKENWIPVESFLKMDLETFAAIKCIGSKSIIDSIAEQIESKLDLHAPVIRDPFNENFFVAQATDRKVNKGNALQYISNHLKCYRPIIAAGDDFNDLTMLHAADTKIVMTTAPKDLLEIADIIAPPVNQNGLAIALSQATKIYDAS